MGAQEVGGSSRKRRGSREAQLLGRTRRGAALLAAPQLPGRLPVRAPLPHFTRSGSKVIIPASAFDDPLGTAPDRHVHWASRADWFSLDADPPVTE